MATVATPYASDLLPPGFDEAVRAAITKVLRRHPPSLRTVALLALKEELVLCIQMAPATGDAEVASAMRVRIEEILAALGDGQE